MPLFEKREELNAMLDHSAISRLQSRYADVITRRAWDELGELFVDDMPLHLDTGTPPVRELVGADAIGAFIDKAVQRFSFFEFVPLNSHIELQPDGDQNTATARLWMCEIRCNGPGTEAEGEWTTAFGLYSDRYRRLDRGWMFAERSYRSLARTGAEGVVLPFPDSI